MKERMSMLVAVLLLVSSLAMSAGPARADDQSNNQDFVLSWNGNDSSGSGGAGPSDGDLEGDPENWLGGQNSVVRPVDDPVDDGGVVVWFKKLLARLLSFAR